MKKTIFLLLLSGVLLAEDSPGGTFAVSAADFTHVSAGSTDSTSPGVQGERPEDFVHVGQGSPGKPEEFEHVSQNAPNIPEKPEDFEHVGQGTQGKPEEFEHVGQGSQGKPEDFEHVSQNPSDTSEKPEDFEHVSQNPSETSENPEDFEHVSSSDTPEKGKPIDASLNTPERQTESPGMDTSYEALAKIAKALDEATGTDIHMKNLATKFAKLNDPVEEQKIVISQDNTIFKAPGTKSGGQIPVANPTGGSGGTPSSGTVSFGTSLGNSGSSSAGVNDLWNGAFSLPDPLQNIQSPNPFSANGNLVIPAAFRAPTIPNSPFDLSGITQLSLYQ